MLGADPHDLLHLACRLDEGDAVRGLVGNVGRRVAVLLANRLAGLETLAEPLLENAEHRFDAGLVALDAPEVAQGHGFLRDWNSSVLVPDLYGVNLQIAWRCPAP